MRSILVLAAAGLLAACNARGGGPARSATGDTAKAHIAFGNQESTATDSLRHWIGIYQWDRRHPTFRPCDFALPLPLRGSDSLLAFLAAKVDFQSPKPTTRLLMETAGDTASADSTTLPVFTITALYDSRPPNPGECVAARGVAAPSLDTTALDAALRRIGPDALRDEHLGGSAYLNADERPDALVLYTGGATCERAGCDLLVFAADSGGYRLVSRTHSVVPPVLVREARSEGWRQLVVGTGVGGAFKGTGAQLRFRRGRYPEDAGLEPPGVDDPNALVLVGGTLRERPLLPGRLPRRWLARPGL
jgi:hypothetical protein